jgi:hypothetical protein
MPPAEYTSSRDAEDALRGMDRLYLGGKELGVSFALQVWDGVGEHLGHMWPAGSTFDCVCLHLCSHVSINNPLHDC